MVDAECSPTVAVNCVGSSNIVIDWHKVNDEANPGMLPSRFATPSFNVCEPVSRVLERRIEDPVKGYYLIIHTLNLPISQNWEI